MFIFNSISALKNKTQEFKQKNKKIGFVPTMGALHQGHLSLIQQAKEMCDEVVCSIFVNPTQFNNLEDLKKYPRTLETDIALLKTVYTDVLFAPEVNEMYTAQELELKARGIEDTSWKDEKTVDFKGIDKLMEGAQRPGHFNGVAQVVSKLFKIVQPDVAFFGQKDFQQLAIIRTMVKQMGFPIQIIACETLRETNGLAMSSRNERLTKEERDKAAVISKTLFAVKEQISFKSIPELKQMAKQLIDAEPLAKFLYFEIVEANTLQPIVDIKQAQSAVACTAVQFGNVRLIDNVVLF